MLISVVTGGTTTTLAGDICIRTDGRVTALNNRASFEPVYDAVTARMPAVVQTINGVSPNDKGEFFLSGSECVSWDLADDDHTIQLVDLCPACTDCESLYRLKQEVIRMKLWLTLLRDVNLYEDGGSRTSVNFLWTRRIAKEALCGEYVLGDAFNDYWKEEGFTKSLRLIQQYMTMVHMWNYLVNRNNKSDVIQVAPEDTAGFSVQTKRSVTSCGYNEQNGGQTISCSISIIGCQAIDDNGAVETAGGPPVELADSTWFGNSGGAATDAYPVSVLIPRAEVEFTPFVNTHTEPKRLYPVGVPAITTQAGIRSNMKINEADVGEPAYKRSVQTIGETGGLELPVVAAGTYAVTVKFLPFVYTTMLDSDGTPISIRGGTMFSDDFWKTTTGSTISFQFFATETKPTYKANPTAQEYLDAKTAPTASVKYKLMWTIKIRWVVKDERGNVNEDVGTYKYVCNGVRQYYTSAVLGGSTIDTEPEPPEEPTNA